MSDTPTKQQNMPLHRPLITRNGTPRQPLLVPSARSKLKLAPFVPADCLEGLQQYSHCWVLYLFHANTSGSSLCGTLASLGCAWLSLQLCPECNWFGHATLECIL